MLKKYRVVYVDAFTVVPFAGNPCAILPDAVGLTDEQMQAIALETNLSETSFVLPSEQADFRREGLAHHRHSRVCDNVYSGPYLRGYLRLFRRVG